MAKTTSFVLGDELNAFIQQQVESGAFASASEVVREALTEYAERTRSRARVLCGPRQGGFGASAPSRACLSASAVVRALTYNKPRALHRCTPRSQGADLHRRGAARSDPEGPTARAAPSLQLLPRVPPLAMPGAPVDTARALRHLGRQFLVRTSGSVGPDGREWAGGGSGPCAGLRSAHSPGDRGPVRPGDTIAPACPAWSSSGRRGACGCCLRTARSAIRPQHQQ
jgi:hypothetical protein